MLQEILIERRLGLSPLHFDELWQYRQLLGFLAWRDIKVRYKQTVLGATWAILQPLMNTLIFTLLFHRLANMPSDNVPYPLFVLAGLLPWTFFANAVSTAGASLVGNSHLITKLFFPRLIIPLSSVLAGLLDLLITFALMAVLMVGYHVPIGASVLLLPVLVAATMLAALGVGTAVAALTVAYRDFRFVVPFMVQVWMFVSPVVYPVSVIPPRWRWVVFVNPMAGIIQGFRSALFASGMNYRQMSISLLASALMFGLGITYFRKVERGFADII